MNSISTTSVGQRVVFYPGIPETIDFGDSFPKMSEEDFFNLCQRLDPMRLERDADGAINIMAPTSGDTGGTNFNLAVEFGIWAKQDGSGKGFDSSTGFVIPNGATRSPDLSWIRNVRWALVSDEDRSTFPHICPDFVVELRSKSDSPMKLDAKMREYIENGVVLAWLIDPIERTVHIYRPEHDIEILVDPAEVSGDPLLIGFTLDLTGIWGR